MAEDKKLPTENPFRQLLTTCPETLLHVIPYCDKETTTALRKTSIGLNKIDSLSKREIYIEQYNNQIKAAERYQSYREEYNRKRWQISIQYADRFITTIADWFIGSLIIFSLSFAAACIGFGFALMLFPAMLAFIGLAVAFKIAVAATMQLTGFYLVCNLIQQLVNEIRQLKNEISNIDRDLIQNNIVTEIPKPAKVPQCDPIQRLNTLQLGAIIEEHFPKGCSQKKEANIENTTYLKKFYQVTPYLCCAGFFSRQQTIAKDKTQINDNIATKRPDLPPTQMTTPTENYNHRASRKHPTLPR